MINDTTPLPNPNFDQTCDYKQRTVATHSTQDQLHYFDTAVFEPPDEYDNILLCMDNAIITIPDDDCEVIPTSPLRNDNNAAITIPDDKCVIV